MKSTSELVIAPVVLRGIAALIDGAILALIALAIMSLLDDSKVEHRETYGAILVVVATYHISFLIAKSATPGKMAMHLYVGDVDGRALTPDRAILRYVAYFIGGTVIAGSLLSIILVFSDKTQRRAVHDRVAGTRVFVGRPEPADDGSSFGRPL